MHEFKPGDSLPCFKHIIGRIKDNNRTTPIVFSVAYLQYLEKCGITDPTDISRYFQKLTLMAQFNQVNRATPLDFLEIKNEKYTLSDDDSLRSYREKLLSLCKEPKSFSALYKTVDERFSACKLCPMSSQYTLRDYTLELELAKYAIQSQVNFNSIISCTNDIDLLFTSCFDLYCILSLPRPYSFPGVNLLFHAIYINVNDYFNRLLNTREYIAITANFKKGLKGSGISPNLKDIPDNYDKKIYDYLMELIESFEMPSNAQAMEYREQLLSRKPYAPIFDADATPSVSIFAGTKKTKKRVQKKKNVDMGQVKSALSLSLDAEMGIIDTPQNSKDGKHKTSPLQEIPVSLEEESKNMVSEPVAAEEVDVITPEGDVILNHSVGEWHDTFGFDDGTDFDDSSLAPEADETAKDDTNGSAPSRKEAPADGTLNHPCTAAEKDKNAVAGNTKKPETAPDGMPDVNLSDPAGTIRNDNANTPSSPDITCKEKEQYNGARIFTYDNLLEPAIITESSSDSIPELICESDVDRFISYALYDGYCIMEPVRMENRDNTYLFLYARDRVGKLQAGSEFVLKFLKNHQYKIGCVHILPLYYTFAKYNIPIHRTDVLIPLDKLVCKDNMGVLAMDIREQLSHSSKIVKETLFSGNGWACILPGNLNEDMYLYSAYGNSLFRSRFLESDGAETFPDISVTYDNSMNLTAEPMTCQKIYAKIPGTLLNFTYESAIPESACLYNRLTRNVVMHLCKKACFNKFRMSLLFYSEQRLVVFAEDYCTDYISNIILMHLFMESDQLGIYPVNVSLKKTKLEITTPAGNPSKQ